MLSVAAMRYARALVDVIAASESGLDPARIRTEIGSIKEMLAGSTELRNVLLSPAVSPSRKRAVMARLLEPLGVTKQVRNFVFVVIDHRRIHEFSAIAEAFDLLLDERLGFVRADVSSAQPLTEAQRTALDAQLSRLAGKRTKLAFTTDPNLLAGVVARVGSTVYDGSIKGQFERLRAKLTKN